MTDPIKECEACGVVIDLNAQDIGYDPRNGDVLWWNKPKGPSRLYAQNVVEALQAERDALAAKLQIVTGDRERYEKRCTELEREEKLWEERCADLEAHIIEIRGVVLMCWGAMAELSPCAHEDCKQQQTEALDLALRKSDELLRKWRELERK